MKHLIWIAGGRTFAQLFFVVYYSSVVYGTWLATGSLVAVAGVAFITVIFAISLIGRTLRVSMDAIGTDVYEMFAKGYSQAMADVNSEIEKAIEERKDENA